MWMARGPYETDDKGSLDTHHQKIHDRIMWVCPIRTCHRWFGTERETLEHLKDEYTGQSNNALNILLDQYRMFDTEGLRGLRRVAENTWTAA